MKALNLTKIIFILALILLCQQIWVPGFFHDGYLYAALGKNAASEGHWLIPKLSDVTYTRFNHHPPLYFMIEGLFFKLFGSDWTQARLFGVIWVFLWIFGMRRLLVRKTDVLTGDLFSLLLILMPDILKKARFPNLDFALALMCGVALLLVWREKRVVRWMISGLLLGLGFWIKGIALFIFGPIFAINLLIDREKLRTLGPYLTIVVMLAIAGLWPLLLWSTDNWDIFTGYLDMQFTHTAIEGRGESMPFYTYIVHVLTTMSHLILLTIWGVYLERSKFLKNELTLLGAVWFLTGLILLSVMKFKYSHYLIPYYPGLALLALPGLRDVYDRSREKFGSYLGAITVLAALALLIFPLTTKTRRHVELIGIEEELAWRKIKVEKFYLVDDAYEFWSTTNYVAYRFNKSVEGLAKVDIDKLPAGIYLLISHPKSLDGSPGIEKVWENHRVSAYLKRK